MYRVMTFNVRMGKANDGAHDWVLRRHAAAEMIRRHAPDLVGLQEAFDFQVDYLREQLPGYIALGAGREDGIRRGEHSLVMVREGTFEVVSSGTYWLSPTPERPSKGWGANFERVVTWTEVRDRQSGRALLFANTHWDHESELARAESAKLMRQRLGTMPAIVVGDFNCTADDEGYRVLTRGGERVLLDAYQAADREIGTWHAFTGTPQCGRIDWILHTQEFRAAAARTDREKIDGLWPSDHFAVVAEIEWAS